jgi:hypothetical protein
LVNKDIRLSCECISPEYSTSTEAASHWLIKIFVLVVRAVLPNIQPQQRAASHWLIKMSVKVVRAVVCHSNKIFVVTVGTVS